MERHCCFRFFTSECNNAKTQTYNDEVLCLTVARVFQSIDKSVFEGNTSHFFTLYGDLLDKLNPTKTTFSKGNHAKNRAVLFAIQHMVLTHHSIIPFEIVAVKGKGFFNSVNEQLDNVLECSSFYPTCFQVRVLKETFKSTVDTTDNSLNLLTFQRLTDAMCSRVSQSTFQDRVGETRRCVLLLIRRRGSAGSGLKTPINRR